MREALNGFLSIAAKEVLHIRRDPTTLVFALLIPMVQLALFGFAVDFDVRHIRTVVVKDGVAHVQAGGGTVADAVPERELREFASQRMAEQGLMEAGAIVAVDAHSADPHSESQDGIAGRNSLLLLDFTGRAGAGPHAIQGDLTRVYFLGERVPDEVLRVAGIVFQAANAEGSPNATSEAGRCVAAITAVCLAGKSAAKTSR